MSIPAPPCCEQCRKQLRRNIVRAMLHKDAPVPERGEWGTWPMTRYDESPERSTVTGWVIGIRKNGFSERFPPEFRRDVYVAIWDGSSGYTGNLFCSSTCAIRYAVRHASSRVNKAGEGLVGRPNQGGAGRHYTENGK